MHFTTMLQLPILATAIWSVTAAIMSASTALADTTARTTSPLLRGHHHFSPRNLIPHPNSGHHSSYYGCLGYSDSELSEAWSFSSQAPGCSWVHIDYSGNDSSGSQGGGSSGGSSSGGSSGSSSSGSSSGGSSSSGSSSGSNSASDGGNDDGSDSSGRSGNADDDENNNYNGGDDSYSGGGQGNGNDDEVVVTNEDVYSGDSEYNPIDDFDIEVCDTYDNLWLWDLSLSCDMTEGDLSLGGCNCTFAEELRDNGLLSCDDTSFCPEDCSICTTCMSLLGCDVTPERPLVSRLLSTTIMLYVIAAAVSLLIFALAAYYSRRKWQDERDLNESLIEKQKHAGNIIGNDYDDKGPSFMYIDGDLMWKPLPSDQQYAASMVQPIGTMSTASTGNEYLEERVQPGSGTRSVGVGSDGDDTNRVRKVEEEEEKTPDVAVSMCEDTMTVPTVVDTLDDIENGLVSPIRTSEETDSSEEDDDENYHDVLVFEDKAPSPINSEENKEQ